MDFIKRQYLLGGSSPEHDYQTFSTAAEFARKLRDILANDTYPHGRDFVGREQTVDFMVATESVTKAIDAVEGVIELLESHQEEASAAIDRKAERLAKYIDAHTITLNEIR